MKEEEINKEELIKRIKTLNKENEELAQGIDERMRQHEHDARKIEELKKENGELNANISTYFDGFQKWKEWEETVNKKTKRAEKEKARLIKEIEEQKADKQRAHNAAEHWHNNAVNYLGEIQRLNEETEELQRSIKVILKTIFIGGKE